MIHTEKEDGKTHLLFKIPYIFLFFRFSVDHIDCTVRCHTVHGRNSDAMSLVDGVDHAAASYVKCHMVNTSAARIEDQITGLNTA